MPSTASSPIRFDYTGARKAGFTDDQIAQSLSAKRAGGAQVFVDRAEVEAYRNSTATATPAPTAPEPTGPRTLALAPAAPSGSVAPPIATPAGSPSELANTLKPPVQFAAGAARGAARAAVDFVKSVPGQAEEFYRQGSQAPYLPGEAPEATKARGAGYQEAARTIAAYTPLETPIGPVLPQMVAQGGAQVIQAGAPVETAQGQRPPTAGEVGERVGGGALGLAMGLPGVVHGAVKRLRPPTPEETAAIHENIATPPTMPPTMRPVSDQASADLGSAVVEMQRSGPVPFKGAGLSIEDAHVIPNLVRVFPKDPLPVRVTVVDMGTGDIHSVGLPSIAALKDAMIRPLPAALEDGVRVAEMPAPNISGKSVLPEQIIPTGAIEAGKAARRERIAQAGAQVAANLPGAQERLATAQAGIAALERQIAENPGDARVGRWRRRVEKLKALPQPEPGLVEQPSAATPKPKGEGIASRGGTEATAPTPVQARPMAGTKGPVPATGTVVRAESPAPARPKAPPSTPMPQGNVGRATQIKTPTQTFTARYEEVPISSLKPSHNPATFEPSPAYPFEQQRDYRGNKREQMKVIGMSKDFNPDYLLADTPTSTDGPPIVSNEGYVLGGNARTMALMRGLEAGDIKERDLQRAVMAHGDKFGIEEPGLEKGTIIVRRLTEKMDLPAQARATKALNEDFKMAVDPISDAVSRARNLTPETVGWLSKALNDAGPDATIKAAIFDDPENLGRLLQKLTDDRVINAPELPRLMDPETDKLTADGQKVIEAAIIGRVIKSPKMIREMSPNLKNAVFSALSPLLKGETFPTEWRINDQVISGLGLYHMADRANKTIDMMLQPQIVSSPFLERMAGDPLAQAVAKWFDANRNKPNALRAALTKYNGLAQDAVSGQGSLLGGTPEPAEAFREAFGVKVNAADFAREPATVIHESRMGGAPATVPRPSRARSGRIGEFRPVGAPPTKAEAADLPESVVPPAPKGTKPSLIQNVAATVKRALYETTALLDPTHLVSREGKDVFYKHTSELERTLSETSRVQRSVERFWDGLSKEKTLNFLTRLERGSKAAPRLAQLASQYRERLDNLFDAISEFKEIPFWDNYFPHFWKDAKKAQQFFTELRARRPMEGTKRFSKQRVLEDIEAGLKAGLELKDWNPERMVQAAERDGGKYVMVQRFIRDGLKSGLIVKVRPGAKAPENFTPFDGRWADIYLNPNVEVKEYHDKAIMEGLQGVAKAIGTRLERKVGIGGKKLGYSESAAGRTGRVVTRFATPESVLAHELGHQIDSKYDLQSVFLREPIAKGKGAGKLNAERIEMKKELRALADMRFEGQDAAAHYKAYVRSGPEKMAVMLEALIHAPERFREVAPKTYARLVSFLASKPELAPLIHIRPSLRYSEGTGTVSAGGPVIGGRYWGQKDLVRVVNNHMSRDPITESVVGAKALALRNLAVAWEFSASAFHATVLGPILAATKLSVGMSQAYEGLTRADGSKLVKAAWSAIRTPLAPAEYLATGYLLRHQSPLFAPLEKILGKKVGLEEATKYLFEGGFKDQRHGDVYRNDALDSFVKHAQKIVTLDRSGIRFTPGSLKSRLGHGVGALGTAPFAALIAPIRAIQWANKYMKRGAFHDIFAWEVERKAKELEAGTTTLPEIARQVMRMVDTRQGLVNYDRYGWNNTLKSALMISTRAPGWVVGTLEAGYAPLVSDLPRAAKEGFTGKRPDITQRMHFVVASTFMALALGSIYHALHGNGWPKTIDDMLHPKNHEGHKVDLPEYLTEWVKWMPFVGNPAKAAAGKFSSVVRVPVALWQNQDYRGPIHRPIASIDDWYPAAKDIAKYLYATETPFSVQAASKMRQQNATPEERFESGFGVRIHQESHARPRRFRERY